GVLWRAWASSPAALEAALGRYLALLYHARDATRAGRRPGRAGLRRFIGEDSGQMVFWQLVDPGENDGDLVLTDIGRVSRLRRQVRAMTGMPDAKCRRLAGIVRQNGPSLVFCTARETVRYLRHHLPGRAAWCTGDAAGIGPLRLPRERVLRWFSPTGREAEPDAPLVLVTTDVSAEGLNLQAARQIIHYDLPWTPMRLDQRDGRAVRLGSIHPEVLIHRFDPSAALEARLRQCTLLLRKRRLPALAGIGEDARRIWRWRDELIQRWGTEESPPRPPAATVNGVEGLLAGFRLESDLGVLATWLGGIDRTGRWRDDAGWVEPFLMRAVAGADPQPPRPETVASAIHRLVPVVRSALRQIRAGQWRRPRQTVETARLIHRLTSLARSAARNRDADRLEAIERALAFTRRGHTAGERQLIAGLAAKPGPELVSWLTRCPAPRPEPSAIWPVLTGLVIGL
ncbi:MAG: C-terminal helicase domain-containing protein, partial [Gemmatimonadales bacterium]